MSYQEAYYKCLGVELSDKTAERRSKRLTREERKQKDEAITMEKIRRKKEIHTIKDGCGTKCPKNVQKSLL